MKIYHVETQGDYNALMIELEEKGCKWRGGEKPTHLDKFGFHGKDNYFYEECGLISFSDGDYFKAYYSNETLIEYKAKGETKMYEYDKTEKLDYKPLVDKDFRKVSKQTFDKLTGEDNSYTVGSLEDINNDIYEIELNGFSYDIVDHIKCSGVYAIITE